MKEKRDAIKANPVATGNEISRDCVNDDSSSDAYGDTCSSWYDSYESAEKAVAHMIPLEKP